jgi:AbiV family abortive infection protein
MHKAYTNACALIEDAETLLPTRPERAISLAVLAMEETAKIFLLCNAIVKAAEHPVEWKEIQREQKLGCHFAKQGAFAAYGTVIEELSEQLGNRFEGFETSVPNGIESLLNWFKQLGFYVDVVNGSFVSPAEFGQNNHETAEWLIAATKERLAHVDRTHSSPEASMEFAQRTAELIDIARTTSDLAILQNGLRDLLRDWSSGATSTRWSGRNMKKVP